jgi:non-specific protein-tyrosine kinase
MGNQLEEKSTAELITEYSSLLWRWFWLLLLFGIVAAAGAYFISFRQTPIYQARALAMINVAPSSQEYMSIYYGQQLAESYAQIMTTGPVRDAVAARLSLPDMSATVQVSPIENTQLLNVIVTDTNPERAALIANTLVEVFSEQIQADQASRYDESKLNLKSQLDVLDEQIQTTSSDLAVLGQEIQSLNASLTSLRQLDTIGFTPEQLINHDNDISQTESNLQTKLSQQAQLQTILQNYRSSYSILLQSYESIRLAESQSSSGILLKDPAEPSLIPVQPQPVRSALLAAVVGLIIAASIVFLREFLDDSLRDPQEITRHWNIPILGLITSYNTGNDTELITSVEPRAPVSEAFRSMRTNIQFASVASPIHTLVVTSSSPSEGKTLISGNLACVVAQGGHKVVVVDADLRRPRVHHILQLKNRFGLADLFLRPQNDLKGAIQSTTVKNLYALTSGSLPPNPSELLASQRMIEIIQALENQFDLVILDVPPSLVVTDANVLANRADGVLLVIRPSISKRAEITHALDQLSQVKANIIGIVINGVNVKSSRNKSYSHYYRNAKEGYSSSDRRKKKKSTSDQDGEISSPATGMEHLP